VEGMARWMYTSLEANAIWRMLDESISEHVLAEWTQKGRDAYYCELTA